MQHKDIKQQERLIIIATDETLYLQENLRSHEISVFEETEKNLSNEINLLPRSNFAFLPEAVKAVYVIPSFNTKRSSWGFSNRFRNHIPVNNIPACALSAYLQIYDLKPYVDNSLQLYI